MTTEQAKQLSESALNRLMAALEQGHSAALKQYLAVMSRFRKYSWTNCLLICSQFPAATFVGGFHFWLKLGRHVRKGEKGIAILAPMVGRKRSSGDEELEENEQTRVFGFKACHVFDVSQTDGRDLPEFATATGDPQGLSRPSHPIRRKPEHSTRIRSQDRASAGYVIGRQDYAPARSFTRRNGGHTRARNWSRTVAPWGAAQPNHSHGPRDRGGSSRIRGLFRHRTRHQHEQFGLRAASWR